MRRLQALSAAGADTRAAPRPSNRRPSPLSAVCSIALLFLPPYPTVVPPAAAQPPPEVGSSQSVSGGGGGDGDSDSGGGGGGAPGATATACPVLCQNGGSCVEAGDDGAGDDARCVCPEGFEGDNCEFGFQVCGGDPPRGGEAGAEAALTCRHGSPCRPKGGSDDGDDEGYFCDCSATYGGRVAGRECEYFAETRCSDALFCTNGGACPPSGSGPQASCDCPPDFEGRRCEFPAGKAPPCTLECINDGICVLPGDPYAPSGRPHAGEDVGGMHCACPDGYAGVLCEEEDDGSAVAGGGDGGGGDGGEPPDERECCNLQCRNGGVCVSAGSGAGDRNGTDEGGTAPVSLPACEPGTVASSEHSSGVEFYCSCPEGYGGPLCEDVAEVEWENGNGQDHDGDENNNDGDENGDACTLSCWNGGVCAFGSRSISPFELATGADFAVQERIRGMHCICPAGFTGVVCDVPYEQCSLNGWDADIIFPGSSADGTGPRYRPQCYHGGVCPESSGGASGMCDCSSTRGPNDVDYVGRYCEYGATAYCSKSSDAEGVAFCANGGTCPQDGTQVGCVCLPGFSGMHCELRESEVNDDGPGAAGAACGNGRRCRNGSECDEDDDVCDCSRADPPIYAGAECEHEATEYCVAATAAVRSRGGGRRAQSMAPMPFCVNGGVCRSVVAEGVAHPGCYCPDEYYGERCEYFLGDAKGEDAEPCGNNLRCRHGSKCVRDAQSPGILRCDCSVVVPPKFAGRECEHEATEYCLPEAAAGTMRSHGGGRRAQDVAEGMLPFCVNGGRCRSIVTQGRAHPGCDCPDAYYGDRCELLVGGGTQGEDGSLGASEQLDPTPDPVPAPARNESSSIENDERGDDPDDPLSSSPPPSPSHPPTDEHSDFDVLGDFNVLSGGTMRQAARAITTFVLCFFSMWF